MSEEPLEERCKKAVLKISQNVEEIKSLLGHFIENYRRDYYDALDGIAYQKVLKQYQK